MRDLHTPDYVINYPLTWRQPLTGVTVFCFLLMQLGIAAVRCIASDVVAIVIVVADNVVGLFCPDMEFIQRGERRLATD